MKGEKIANNKELNEYIKKNSKVVNHITGNDYLFTETLWVICENYYRLRTRLENDATKQQL